MANFAIPDLHVKSVLKWVAVFSGFALLNMMLLCANCFSDGIWVVRNFTYAFLLFSSLWLGNGFIGSALNRVVTWVDNPGKRFLITIVATTLFSAVAILLVNWVYIVLLNGLSAELLLSTRFRWTMLTQLLVTFFITLSVYAVSFLRSWREAAVKAERFQKENALSQYEALKNQVNPHFLFNSLNALTSLVHPSPDLAVKFIKQLSEVYRYVLDSQHKEVVELEEELAFAQRYVFLQQIRHAEGLQVTLPDNVPPGFYVPPLALQMLLENAIKHNKILAKEPLHIQVTVEGDTLRIENNLQPKTQHEPPSGLGLPNIQARYQMLTNRPVEVLPTPSYFIVQLPLLTFQ
ncbi:histidine kinase [Nibribacter ruber]|uniref:Histidine kinase n=1 Tax=Nibribacter ruber TaxID=2698458 RepID=A0A6P1P221_9BACT|nr:histidine kinase [Nibribacter ruber]QHL88432.1 histidine kinase [Nibribacter ruber]